MHRSIQSARCAHLMDCTAHRQNYQDTIVDQTQRLPWRDGAKAVMAMVHTALRDMQLRAQAQPSAGEPRHRFITFHVETIESVPLTHLEPCDAPQAMMGLDPPNQASLPRVVLKYLQSRPNAPGVFGGNYGR